MIPFYSTDKPLPFKFRTYFGISASWLIYVVDPKEAEASACSVDIYDSKGSSLWPHACAAYQSYFGCLVCQQHSSLASAFSVSLCFGVFYFITDVSSETSTLHAYKPWLCPSLPTLPCRLPLEDWDDHPLCTSCQALSDPHVIAGSPALFVYSGHISLLHRTSLPDREVPCFFLSPPPSRTCHHFHLYFL